MMTPQIEKELNAFFEDWQDSQKKNGVLFIQLKDVLTTRDGITRCFIARNGVTYPLRTAHAHQKDRDRFVMVDVIEDIPRWLPVCF